MHDHCPPTTLAVAALFWAQEPPATCAGQVNAANGDPGCSSSHCKLCMRYFLACSCRSLLASLQPSWMRRMRRL